MFEITINAKAFYNYLNSLLNDGELTEEEYTAVQKFLALDLDTQNHAISEALENNTTDEFWYVTDDLISGAVRDVITDNKD